MLKKCSKCLIEKELVEFSKHSKTKDTFQYWCKYCTLNCEKKYRNKNYISIVSNKKAHRSKRSIKDKRNKHEREKRARDFVYKFAVNMRNRFNSWLNGFKKDKRTFEYINCTKQELVKYLESLFQPGMSWENYGEWHIDHVIPLSSFDRTNEEDMHKAWTKENLQPLWAIDNIRKGNRIT